MANKNKSDLHEFKTWLLKEKHVSRASSSVYASRVRKILSRLECLTVDEINRVMESLVKESFNSHMSCWRHFHEFCATKDIIVPLPTFKKSAKIAMKEQNLPELVTLALLRVIDMCGLKPQVMVGLTWDNVQMRGNADWWISDPLDKTTMYMAPSNSMRIICDWANGPDHIVKERPFIPKAALSMIPMSKANIKRSISGRRRNRLQ